MTAKATLASRFPSGTILVYDEYFLSIEQVINIIDCNTYSKFGRSLIFIAMR
jgi:hypothetical protein